MNNCGFRCMFFPRYHCELNPIEMSWAWIKTHHRCTCTYDFSTLKAELPITLIQLLPLSFVRKTFQHCYRFMNGYRIGLVGPALEYSVKKYKGHRSFPQNCVADQ
jgi:transposase